MGALCAHLRKKKSSAVLLFGRSLVSVCMNYEIKERELEGSRKTAGVYPLLPAAAGAANPVQNILQIKITETQLYQYNQN